MPYAERNIKTIKQMYETLAEGCIHVRRAARTDICLACRLEIFSELKRLHELEDKVLSLEETYFRADEISDNLRGKFGKL